MKITLKVFRHCCLIICALSLSVSVAAGADQSFMKWLESFYPVAARQGISRATYDLAFAGVTEPDKAVLKKAAYFG